MAEEATDKGCQASVAPLDSAAGALPDADAAPNDKLMRELGKVPLTV